MKNDLVPIVYEFIFKEKIDLSLSEENASEFWLDESSGSITVKFKVDISNHEILYDVYSPKYSEHLTEETIKDVETLEHDAEDNRKWKIAEAIENIWLVLDQIRLWAEKNNFRIKEKKLV